MQRLVGVLEVDELPAPLGVGHRVELLGDVLRLGRDGLQRGVAGLGLTEGKLGCSRGSRGPGAGGGGRRPRLGGLLCLTTGLTLGMLLSPRKTVTIGSKNVGTLSPDALPEEEAAE